MGSYTRRMCRFQEGLGPWPRPTHPPPGLGLLAGGRDVWCCAVVLCGLEISPALYGHVYGQAPCQKPSGVIFPLRHPGWGPAGPGPGPGRGCATAKGGWASPGRGGGPGPGAAVWLPQAFAWPSAPQAPAAIAPWVRSSGTATHVYGEGRLLAVALATQKLTRAPAFLAVWL